MKRNAVYQKRWREKNADVLIKHRALRPAFTRLCDGENAHMAWDLAQLLRDAIGPENCKHLARWLTKPKAERPPISFKL